MTFDVNNLKVTEGHRALAAYIKAESGKAPSAATVALVQTLAVEYRKSEGYLAEQARKKAAKAEKEAALRRRKEDRLEKALEQARKLAADLGLVIEADGHPVPDPEPDFGEPEEVTLANPERVVVEEQPAKATKAKRTRPLAVVPDDDDEPVVAVPDPDADTSAIVVEESSDGFVAVGGEESDDDDDFFDDDDEGDDDVEDY